MKLFINPYLIILIVGVLIIIVNLCLVIFDSDIIKWKKIGSIILAFLLISSISAQYIITTRSEAESKRKINDMDIKISFTVNPNSIDAISSNPELAKYLPKRNIIGIDKEFLRKLEENKNEIFSEIFKDWSLSLSRKVGSGFKAKYYEKINDFSFESVEAGRYSFHLKCLVSYNIKTTSYLNLRNIKELNSDLFSLYIISNPNNSKQIIDKIQMKLNTNEALIDNTTEFVYESGIDDVIPQVNNALNNLTLTKISELIEENSKNLNSPIILNTKRGDGLWVWHVEQEFSEKEY